MTLGNKIREAREAKGYTEAELAARMTLAGFSTTARDVQRWELDANIPKTQAVHAIGLVLGIRMDLFKGVELAAS